MQNAFLCRPLPFTILSDEIGTAAGPVGNVANDRLGRVWQTLDAAPQILIDVGPGVAIDTLALVGTSLVETDSIYWRGANDPAAFSGVGEVLATGFGIGQSGALAGQLHRQSVLALPAPVTARYWICSMSLRAQSTLARLVVGKAFRPAETFDYGFEVGVTERGQSELSQAGPRNAMPGSRHLQFRWTWGWLDPAEAMAEGVRLQAYAGSTRPVLFCADLDSTYLHNLIGYGPIAEGPRFQQIAVDGFTNSYQLDSDTILSL